MAVSTSTLGLASAPTIGLGSTVTSVSWHIHHHFVIISFVITITNLISHEHFHECVNLTIIIITTTISSPSYRYHHVYVCSAVRPWLRFQWDISWYLLLIITIIVITISSWCLQRYAALTVAPMGLARVTPVAVTRAGQVHYHPDHHHHHYRYHHHHCYCYRHNQDRHDHDHGPHPFLYDQLIIIWLELHQLQISSSSQLSSSSSLLPTLSPSSQSSPSHAQNLNSVPQVQLALAAPAATDVKTMDSAPMAPVSVSKGGMESKLL